MDFGLNSEQVLMQDTVRRLLEDMQPPQQVIASIDSGADGDGALWEAISELGLPGLMIAEEYGGAGLTPLDAALMAEVAGEAALIGGLESHYIAALAIELGGSDEQKSRWLPLLASGDAISTVAWAETGDLWAPEFWSTAMEDGCITGDKAHVPCASQAAVIVVGLSGGGLALVEASGQGIEITPFDGVDQTRRLSDLRFSSAPAEELPQGKQVASRVHDFGLVLHAADAFGCAAKLIAETKNYLSERKQFGFVLTQFQGVKHELANMAASLEPTRALWWYAAYACGEDEEDAAKVCALAKAHISTVAMSIARACIDLHGAIGYTWEATPHLWYKRIMFDRAFLGGPDAHFARAADVSAWGRVDRP